MYCFAKKMNDAIITVLKDTHKIHSIINNIIIIWGFCDIQNNQGQGKGYQPKLKAEVDNPYRDLDYSGYQKNRI